MVEEDLNPGSSISHLCYRTVVLNKSARAEHISEKDKLAVVEILVKASVNDSHAMDTSLWIESKNETGDVLISAVNVSTSSECPRAFTSAGGDVLQGMQASPRVKICFRVQKVPNVDNPFKVIDLVKGERVARIAATKCAFIEALNYTMCIMQVPDKSRKVVKRVKHSNSTAASSNTTTRVAQNATMRTSSASNKTKSNTTCY